MPGPSKPASKKKHPQLRPNPAWQKGMKPVNPGGRPKAFKGFREAMRAAFETTEHDPFKKRTLTEVILGKAFDDGNPDQMNAIKFAAAYAFGLPKAGLDEETITKLGQEMAQQMFAAALEEARKRRMLEAETPAAIPGQPDQ